MIRHHQHPGFLEIVPIDFPRVPPAPLFPPREIYEAESLMPSVVDANREEKNKKKKKKRRKKARYQLGKSTISLSLVS